MKSKLKNKIITLIMALSFIGISTQSFAGDTYAVQGAWAGAVGLGAPVYTLTLSFFLSEELHDRCNASSGSEDSGCYSGGVGGVIGYPLLYGGIAAGVGAGIGALIGLAIPNHPKVSVVPMFIQSKTQGNTTGGSVEFNF